MLNGHPFEVVENSWKGRDVIDFAPKAPLPDGGVVYSDLQMYQPLAVQTDFSHGMGFIWSDDAAGYMYTTGNVDTRQKGLAMMMTHPTESCTTDNASMTPTACVHGGYTLFGTTDGVRGWNSTGGWVDVPVSDTTIPSINALFSNGDYVFVCQDGKRIRKSASISDPPVAGDWSDAGVDASSIDFSWMTAHGGYIYAGKDAKNRIHFDGNADLSQLAGDTDGDTAEIYIGAGDSMKSLGGISYIEKLWLPREDGLWAMGDDKIPRMSLNFTSERSSLNFASMAVHNGYLYFPIRQRVYQYNGARLSDVTPRAMSDSWPYVTFGNFRHFVSIGDCLYMVAKTNETTAQEMIIAWDGVGWHRICTPVADATTTSITMMFFDPSNSFLWYHVSKTGAGAYEKTYYIPFQTLSKYAYGDFNTSSTDSYIYTYRIEGGYRRVDKSAVKLYVDARNLSQVRYIRVWYSLDGSSDWIEWDDVVEDGVTMLTYPGGEKSVEFNYAQLGFQFVTDTDSQTPVLEGWALIGMMRPDTKWGYTFQVFIENAKQKEQLREARNSKEPIPLITILGEEVWGYVSQLQEDQVAPGNDAGGSLDAVVQINFVETLGEDLSVLKPETDVNLPGSKTR